MTEKKQDAPYESTRDAGSTPATSTIFPSICGASGAIAKLLLDYCPNFDGRLDYPRGYGSYLKEKKSLPEECLRAVLSS